jgi:hypothetical protein
VPILPIDANRIRDWSILVAPKDHARVVLDQSAGNIRLPRESLTRLRSWGVTILFDPERYPLPTPNLGSELPSYFPGTR